LFETGGITGQAGNTDERSHEASPWLSEMANFTAVRDGCNAKKDKTLKHILSHPFKSLS
ncbi:MAG: hypothetical protein RI964_3120, partial [Pseudomonadota bacterium]|jgi:hypothetical protein